VDRIERDIVIAAPPDVVWEVVTEAVGQLRDYAQAR
jgi:hypothetical protein